MNDINYHVYEKDKSKPLTKVNHYMEYPCKICGDFEFSPMDSLLLPNETLFEKQELSEKYRYRSNLLSAYAVIAGLQNQVEDDERNMRAARRQIELFMEDGKRERLTVALALLDASVEARNEAWFDFTEQRGQ